MTHEPKIKVLFRLRSLEMGGVVKVLIDILKHLPKDKLEIDLMVNLYQGELRDQIPPEIKIIKIAKGKEDFSLNPTLRKIQMAARLLKLKILETFPFLLYNFFYKKKYDIEIAFGRAELEMVLKSPQKTSQKIAWVHWEFSHQPEMNKSDLLVQQLGQFDHVIFCSDNVRKQVKTLYEIEFPNYSVIHNVIHPEEIYAQSIVEIPSLNFKDDLFTFSSVGRIKNGKGYPLLLEIHKQLIDQGFFHRIIIAGDGDKLEELRRRANDLGVAETFILLGNKNNPFPYIKHSQAFILPTQTEAYPLSIKEALILGLPVLVTDVGGVSEIVDDNLDGLLMKYDELDIIEKMQRIITDKELYSQLKTKASQASEKFEVEEIYTKIEQLFLNLKNGK